MIDPLAVVDPQAQLASDVVVDAFAVIGPDVSIGAGSWVGAHSVISGPTVIGVNNKIHPFSAIGGDPQDKKYSGGDSRLSIGSNNVIREYCTINRGTELGGGETKIGDHNWIMAYVHIAHDCSVGNHTVFANNATLAGHVDVEDYVTLGGFTLVHQFCTLGAYAFSGMGTAISKDVPPYILVNGNPARARGINVEGLRRHDFSAEDLKALKLAYKTVYRSGKTVAECFPVLAKQATSCEKVARFSSFLESNSRGIVR